MKSIAKEQNEVDVVEETGKFGIKIVIGLAALVGVWGVACMIGGLAVAGGPVVLAKMFIASLMV